MNEEARQILVADDEESILRLVDRALSEAGFAVHTARDGVTGLEVVRQTKLALVILDMNMPNMGGISFYHQLCSQCDMSSRPAVLVLTGAGSLESVFEGLQIDGFMTKPFQIDDLVDKVKEIIIRKETEG